MVVVVVVVVVKKNNSGSSSNGSSSLRLVLSGNAASGSGHPIYLRLGTIH